MVNFRSLFGIFLILGFLQVPLGMFFRRQARSNPARQTAFGEPVIFQAAIAMRSRLPTRLWRPNHWYFANSNVVSIFVRATTVQVSSSILRRPGRRYGWFLQSSTTTMWLSSMRPYPLSKGQQECIILSGSFPFRGAEREVQLAIFSHDQVSRIWDALITSGVRGVAAPVGEDAPDLALQTSGRPPTTFPGPRVPQSYAPSMQAPSYAPTFAPPSRRSRLPFVWIGFILCLPLLAGFILSHVSRHEGNFVVEVSGPANVATLTDASCAPVIGRAPAGVTDHEANVSGTITATVNAPLGLAIHMSMETSSGVPIGVDGATTTAPLTQGQSESFQLLANGEGYTQNANRCVISWTANTSG
jgi:hypothetical protein